MNPISSDVPKTLNEAPWTLPVAEVLPTFQTSRDGLSESEVTRRQRSHGPNQLVESRQRSTWLIFADQFRSPLVALLAGAAVLSMTFSGWHEAVAIVVVLLINGVVGFLCELRAASSMAALRQLGATHSNVARDGIVRAVPTQELVPGDLIVLESGEVIGADLRIIEASKITADESMLTGESVPVRKNADAVSGHPPISELSNMLFKGTAMTCGSGLGVVVGIGMNTELGRIFGLVETATSESTPLEKRLTRLGGRLLWTTLAIAGFIAILGIVNGKDPMLIVQTAIALAVATVPEGLPIIATLALARGMQRMARRHALVNRLSAVETLGATNVIFTDKTGTLTENRMTLTEASLASGSFRAKPDAGGHLQKIETSLPLDDALLSEALELGVLCNDASLGLNAAPVGDPLEVALLIGGQKARIERGPLLDQWPEVREVAFDPESRLMATVHRASEGFRVAVKGAPESVIAICSRCRTTEGEEPLTPTGREAWLTKNEEMASQGLRVLAVATKSTAESTADPYRDLVLVGLLGLLDPPRTGVTDSIAACRSAGVSVIMVTGDQLATAQNIARTVGITEDVVARASPKRKLDLIAEYQKRGLVVAMTGDGVNDAPALKQADIGVAMGQRGTDVAREAADIVLLDDAFGTIVVAIEQGRVIFDNIRRFVCYLLSCNISEVLVVGLAAAVDSPLPILPLQILFLNLVTDVFPAFALIAGEGGSHVMARPPRGRNEGILESTHWRFIAIYGAFLTISVLGAFSIALHVLHLSPNAASSVAFLTLAFAQLWHVFNLRSEGENLFNNDITRNWLVWGALLLCTVLLCAAVFIEPFAALLDVHVPDARAWGIIIPASVLPILLGVGLRWVRRLLVRAP